MKRRTPTIDFMRYRQLAGVLSLLLVLAATASLAFRQLSWGLDFTGGSMVEVAYPAPVDPVQIRRDLEAAGFTGQTVQHFGADTELLIRMPPQEGLDATENAGLGDRVHEALAALEPGILLRRSEYVGPAVGEELAESGGLGLLAALLCVMVYIMFRFQWKFALGAVVALFHDVVITLGIFSVAGWTFDQTVLAALLAVIGYSLNDTIVVSDRIRENFRKLRRASPTETVNTSLNQTLARTLVTSFTTLLVLLALLFLGGELIRGFALGLTIGVLVGTYSSIYIAANMLLTLGVKREDLAVPVKEGEDQTDLERGY